MNINYTHLIPLISEARSNAINSSFNGLLSNRQIIGIYLWQQKVTSMLQPIIQIIELSLRNSFHKECNNRFVHPEGKWWKCPNLQYNIHGTNYKNFQDKIAKAESSFKTEYKRKNSVPFHGSVNADDIIANTILYTWELLLSSDFISINPSQNNNYIWPKSINKIFRGLNNTEKNQSPTKTINDLLNLIKSFRDLRNRVSHHDCLWTKSSLPTHSTNIEFIAKEVSKTIQKKINKLAQLIYKISPNMNSLIDNWGIFIHLNEAVSHQNLLNFIDKNYFKFSSINEKDRFFSIYISHINDAYNIAKTNSNTICKTK